MAVKIRLKRLGKIRAPHYRVVIADSRKKRDGRVIEEIGKYHPTQEPSFIEINRDRVQYWLGVGAQPSEPVLSILKVTGDWQLFKGLPGIEGTLKTKESKVDSADLVKAADDDAELRKAKSSEAKAEDESKAAADAKSEGDKSADAASPAEEDAKAESTEE